MTKVVKNKDIIKICSNNKFQKMITVSANRAIKASHRRMRKRGMILIKKGKNYEEF